MLSVIIPHWNNKKLLKTCLETILGLVRHASEESDSATTRGVTPLEVIIVDNGSTDNSVDFVRMFKESNSNVQIILIKNDQNLGFARAVNQGINAAKNDWVVVMNNDVKISKNWFVEIKKELSRPKVVGEQVGCLFGKVLNWEGTEIESVGLDFDIKGKSRNIGKGKNRIEKYKQKKFIWGAPASIVVYRKQALKEVDGFDEDFFAYLEDVDLSIRLNNRGWKTLYLPNALSYHYGGKTADQISGFRQRYTARNWWYIIIKHYPIKVFLINLPKIFLEQLKNFLAIKKINDKIWLVKGLIANFDKIWKKRQPKKLKN